MNGTISRDRIRRSSRPGFRLSWSDPAVRNVVWQVLVVGVVVGVVWYLVGNTTRNLAARHIATGFGFLGNVAGIPIGEHLIDYDPAVDTFGRAMVIGILNTLKVSIFGIVLSTVLGVLIGIARLSQNWLVSKLAAIYVEGLRGVPLLLQLLFWYALLHSLPAPRQAWQIGQAFFLSNRGFKLPALQWQNAHWWMLAAFVLGIVGTLIVSKWADRRQELTGIRPQQWWIVVLLLIGLPFGVWVMFGMPFTLDYPVLKGFDFRGGGTISPEFGALLIGLVTFTAAENAEIVRAGIQAVPRGQFEATAALGFKSSTTFRLVILPQALRVIVPPMTSQYLSLVKNSSLAVAIGYQDVVSIADTTSNQTGQAIESIALIMVVYLFISLSISLFMNWYNSHIALTER